MNNGIAIGIIGGSGLYEMEELTDVENVSMETPFGAPSLPLLKRMAAVLSRGTFLI